MKKDYEYLNQINFPYDLKKIPESKLQNVADDIIDYKGNSFVAGKKTGKDKIKGKATLISLLGYKNTINYANNLILKIDNKVKKYGSRSNNLSKTLNYILNRNK